MRPISGTQPSFCGSTSQRDCPSSKETPQHDTPLVKEAEMKTYVVELKYTAYATRMVEAEAIAHVSPLDDGYGEWTTDDAYEWERNNDQPSREG
jgi:hypothetical protein